MRWPRRPGRRISPTHLFTIAATPPAPPRTPPSSHRHGVGRAFGASPAEHDRGPWRRPCRRSADPADKRHNSRAFAQAGAPRRRARGYSVTALVRRCARGLPDVVHAAVLRPCATRQHRHGPASGSIRVAAERGRRDEKWSLKAAGARAPAAWPPRPGLPSHGRATLTASIFLNSSY